LLDNVIDAESYKLMTVGRTQRHHICTIDRSQNQHLWFLWPNTSFGIYPIPGFGETFCMRTMHATRYNRAIYHYRWFVDEDRDPSIVIEYAKHHGTTTGAEDEMVAAGVQHGIKSLGFRNATLLANPAAAHVSEHAIIQFHGWVLDALGHQRGPPQ